MSGIEKISTGVNSVANSANNTTDIIKKATILARMAKTNKTDENENVSFMPTSDNSKAAESASFWSKLVDSIFSILGIKTDNKETEPNEDEVPDSAENDNKYSGYNESFDEMLNHIYDFEGGYSNDPNDRGGATNYGIIQSTYDAWNDKNGNPRQDVANITKEEASQIYYEEFYVASGAKDYADNGNTAYAFVLFDSAVNHGIGNAAEFDAEANGDVDKFMAARKQFYLDIVDNDASQADFEYGWQNRWNNVYSIIDPNHEYENYVDEHKGQ